MWWGACVFRLSSSFKMVNYGSNWDHNTYEPGQQSLHLIVHLISRGHILLKLPGKLMWSSLRQSESLPHPMALLRKATALNSHACKQTSCPMKRTLKTGCQLFQFFFFFLRFWKIILVHCWLKACFWKQLLQLVTSNVFFFLFVIIRWMYSKSTVQYR